MRQDRGIAEPAQWLADTMDAIGTLEKHMPADFDRRAFGRVRVLLSCLEIDGGTDDIPAIIPFREHVRIYWWRGGRELSVTVPARGPIDFRYTFGPDRAIGRSRSACATEIRVLINLVLRGTAESKRGT